MTSLNLDKRAEGFSMPAEWEPHQATWLSWPHNLETWPGSPLLEIQKVWVEIVYYLHTGEEVHINVENDLMEEEARSLLQERRVDFSNVFFHHFPTNDTWIRDHGPIFIMGEKKGKNQLALLDWNYNAWGDKYPPYDLDNAIPEQIAAYLKMERISLGWVLEGGSIEVNGSGTLLTTESCLLNPNRNPQLNRSEIEELLRHYLGVKKILWLGDGIVGDDTDGHIDDLARFVASDTVVTVVEEDFNDENYQALQENFQRLTEMSDEKGTPLKIIQLPMPAPIESDTGRLPASYANFYIANDVVLVPTFEDPKDGQALDKIKRLFPTRRTVGINCRQVVKGLGAFHCVTQQQPK